MEIMKFEQIDKHTQINIYIYIYSRIVVRPVYRVLEENSKYMYVAYGFAMEEWMPSPFGATDSFTERV